jgi:hypothetical protein
MDDTKHRVKVACMFAVCPEPATVTVAIAYPGTPERPAFTWDGAGRCPEHLQTELELAALVGATVAATPISQGVPA